MKYLFLFISLALFLGGCKHKDPGLTSAEGAWTYSTPDNKVVITFELVPASAGGLDIQNPTIKIDGTLYKAASQITGVVLPLVQKIRINANDVKAVYGYYIELNSGTVSSDFKSITFSTAAYTWPWGTVNSLTAVKAMRLK